MSLQNVPALKGTLPNASNPEFPSKKSTTKLIGNLVKNILIETAGIALLSKVTCYYAISLSTATLLPYLAIGIIITNTLFKSVGCYLQYRRLGQQETAPDCPRSSLDRLKTIAQWVPALNFALFFGATGNLLIHEAGHISVASLIYKGLKAQITIPGLFSGAVSWTKIGFTAIGGSLGGLNSRLLVCVAGPLTATFIASIALVASIHCRDRFPELSKYVTLSALMTIGYQVLYALTALLASQSDLGHDFVMMRQVGLHPIVASLILASIPIIALATYFRLRTKLPREA